MPRTSIPRSGTVYTPDALARAMVSALGDRPGARWLDPCVGDGAFIRALAGIGVEPERVTAIDVVEKPSRHDHHAKTRRRTDFIDWTAQAEEKFDRIVLNPPYIALTRIKGPARRAALALRFDDESGLSLKANYWCAFLLACVRVLSRGGALCAVLPAAWDFAQYAHKVRELFGRSFAALMVIRSRTPLFGQVLEGSVVLVARDFRGQGHRSRRLEVEGTAGMIKALTSPGTSPAAGSITPRPGPPPPALHRAALRDLVDIRIGGVTGDARFFLLDEPERQRLGLPEGACRPVLSRAKHLCAPIMNDGVWRALRDAGERVWLFRPPRRLIRHPSVDAYLNLDEEDGGCRMSRYKIERRDPWYETPVPEHTDGFLSGMSRRGPFLVLNGCRGLTATNTLYVVRFRSGGSRTDKASLGIVLLSRAVREQIARCARLYPDGLLKFEPAELGAMLVRVPRRSEGAMEVFEMATRLLLSGQEGHAQALADAWLDGEDWRSMLDRTRDGWRMNGERRATSR